MRYDDPAFAVAVRMCVLLCGPAMSGPARVSQAEMAGHRLFVEQIFKVFQLTGCPTNLKLSILNDGDARRVVPSIFERTKALHD
jgi:hypothetical protein